jgi:Fe-S-cluster containining protein
MKNFECKKCGKCCSNYLPLTKEEIKTMKRIKKGK